MSSLDWIILFGTLITIVVYGVYKSRGSKNIDSYLLGDKSLRWWGIGLSVMATQASAITPCLDALDINDDNDLDTEDALLLLGYLFQGGPPPAPPFPNSGLDPTPMGPGCDF